MPEQNNNYLITCSIRCINYHVKPETGDWCWGQGLPPRKVHEGDACWRDYTKEDIARLEQLSNPRNPNKVTLKAMKEIEKGRSKSFNSIDEFFEDLDKPKVSKDPDNKYASSGRGQKPKRLRGFNADEQQHFRDMLDADDCVG